MGTDKKESKTDTAQDPKTAPHRVTLDEDTQEIPIPNGPSAKHPEFEKAKSDLLYLQAEFENYKKQTIKERSELIKYGAERIIRDILGVVDIFDQALGSELTPSNLKSFHDGMSMTAQELKSVLDRFGVVSVDCLGKPFDPTLCEALGSEETDKFPPGVVSKVFRPAYKLHERLLRPAQVIVAREKAGTAKE